MNAAADVIASAIKDYGPREGVGEYVLAALQREFPETIALGLSGFERITYVPGPVVAE